MLQTKKSLPPSHRPHKDRPTEKQGLVQPGRIETRMDGPEFLITQYRDPMKRCFWDQIRQRTYIMPQMLFHVYSSFRIGRLLDNPWNQIG